MKEVITENLNEVSKEVKENIKKDDVTALAKTYIELDELSKKVVADLDKIKRHLIKKSDLKEEFPELGKYLASVGGRAMTHISVKGLSADFGSDEVVSFATVSEKDFREYLVKKNPDKKDFEIDAIISKYKISDGVSSSSIRIYKLTE